MYKIVCVTNRKSVEGDFLERIRRIAACKPYAVILREKDLVESEYLPLADKVCEICERNGVKFIAHTYVSAARGCLHLPVSQLQALGMDMGASCHSVADAEKAVHYGCKYITFGHIFPTECKRDLSPRGIEELTRVCRSVPLPVYAIGGITPDNAPQVIAAGAHGICIMSSAMRGDVEALFDKFEKNYADCESTKKEQI